MCDGKAICTASVSDLITNHVMPFSAHLHADIDMGWWVHLAGIKNKDVSEMGLGIDLLKYWVLAQGLRVCMWLLPQGSCLHARPFLALPRMPEDFP